MKPRFFRQAAVSLVLLAAGAVSLLAGPPTIEPQARPVLDRFLELYQKSASFKVNARQIRRVDGKEDADASMQVIARKPNEARIQIMAQEAVITFVNDGRQLVIHQSPPNTWVTKKGVFSIPDLTKNMLTGLESLTTANVRSSVLDGVTSIRLGQGEAAVAGRECWLLEMEQPGCTIDCWIAKEPQPALARLRIRIKEKGHEIEMETTYSRWKFNPEITAETFRFRPPADAEEGGTASL